MFFYDEARNSGCAREMFERGDLIVPTFNYELRSDKPPLHYYFMMLAYSIFGVSEFSSRFFSAIFGALTILMTFLFIRKHLGFKPAVYSALVLLASLNLTLEFHLAVPDPYLIFFMTAANFAFYDFYVTRKIAPLILMYISIGLAMLAKGPIALGLFGLTGLLFLLIKKDFTWKTLKVFRLIKGAIIFIAITLPWFIEVGLATNWRWQQEFIIDQNINRLTDEKEGHGGFFGLIIVFVFLAFLPFSLFLIQSFREAFRKWKENDLLLFSMIISAVVVLFFSISATKLPNYPMISYPFIALLIGYYLSFGKIKCMNGLLILNLLISIAIPVGAYILIRNVNEISSHEYLSWSFAFIPICAIIALWLWFRFKSLNGVIISLSASWIVTSLIVFLWILPVISREDPVHQAIKLIDTTKPLAYYRRYNSAFPFYVKKPILKLLTIEEVNQFFQENPDGYLISATQFEEELKKLQINEIFRKKDLFEPPVTLIYQRQK